VRVQSAALQFCRALGKGKRLCWPVPLAISSARPFAGVFAEINKASYVPVAGGPRADIAPLAGSHAGGGGGSLPVMGRRPSAQWRDTVSGRMVVIDQGSDRAQYAMRQRLVWKAYRLFPRSDKSGMAGIGAKHTCGRGKKCAVRPRRDGFGEGLAAIF